MDQFTLITISPDELKKIIADSVQEALSKFLNDKSLPTGDYPVSRSVNLEAICKIYGWKKPTVYGWVHNRLIPNSKVGKALYFNIVEIEKWIASGRRKTVTEIEEEANNYIVNKRFGKKQY